MTIKTEEEVLREINNQIAKEDRKSINEICPMCKTQKTMIRRKDTKNTGYVCTNQDCALKTNMKKVKTWEVVR